LPGSGAGHRTPRGHAGIWTPGAGFLIVRFTRIGDKALAEPIIDSFRELVDSAVPVRVFFDLETMATYDSELRTALTACFFKDRKRLRTFDVLVGSKLTAMGVSVANLTLGGIITSHSRRMPFVTALDAALTAAGVTAFSSSALLEA
jgi:hypothetical protein